MLKHGKLQIRNKSSKSRKNRKKFKTNFNVFHNKYPNGKNENYYLDKY